MRVEYLRVSAILDVVLRLRDRKCYTGDEDEMGMNEKCVSFKRGKYDCIITKLPTDICFPLCKKGEHKKRRYTASLNRDQRLLL